MNKWHQVESRKQHLPIGCQPAGKSPSQSDKSYSFSRKNLWGLLIFLLASICAYGLRDFNLFELSSEPLRQVLGYPPPAYLITLALAVYCFSCVILTLTAMARGAQPEPRWNHLGYRTAFFVFYSFSGAIADNFIPVVLVGFALYLLDHCHIQMYNLKMAAEEREVLKNF